MGEGAPDGATASPLVQAPSIKRGITVQFPMPPSTTDRTTPAAPGFSQMALLLALGWALTNIAYAIYDLPLKILCCQAGGFVA